MRGRGTALAVDEVMIGQLSVFTSSVSLMADTFPSRGRLPNKLSNNYVLKESFYCGG